MAHDPADTPAHPAARPAPTTRLEPTAPTQKLETVEATKRLDGVAVHSAAGNFVQSLLGIIVPIGAFLLSAIALLPMANVLNAEVSEWIKDAALGGARAESVSEGAETNVALFCGIAGAIIFIGTARLCFKIAKAAASWVTR